MKLTRFISLVACCVAPLSLSLVVSSCGGGGGSDDDSTTETVMTEVVDDPTDTTASNTGTSSDNNGAVVANEAQYIQEVFIAINDVRAANGGLSPLTEDSELAALAESHNEYMASVAPANADPIQISHDNANDRAQQAFALGYIRYGENVGGIRNFDADEVSSTMVEGWVNSTGHFEAIIGDFTHTGIDIMVDPTDGTIYATQIFTKQ